MLSSKEFKNGMSHLRHPTKSDCLVQLHRMGVPMGDILDVGVHFCTPELMTAFKDHHHVLMEPVDEHSEAIKRIYSEAKISHELLNVAVSNEDGETSLKVSTAYGDKGITHSNIVAGAPAGDGYRTVPTIKLSTVVNQRQLKEPFFLKIDVDGAEVLVLEGAKDILSKCSVVMIEVGIGNFIERTKMLIEAGFRAFDLCGLSYYNGHFVQADMVFLNNELVPEKEFFRFKGGFSGSLWQNYVPEQ